MFSSQHAHSRIEGFAIPPLAGPASAAAQGRTATPSASAERPLAGAPQPNPYVDPSFIFSQQLPSFAQPKPFATGAHSQHLHQQGVGSGALSDLDLYDDASYASLLASAASNAQHHAFNSPSSLPIGTAASAASPYPSFDSFYAHHQQPPNALQHFLQQAGASIPRSPSASLPGGFNSHSSPRDSRSPSAGTDLFGGTPGVIDSPAAGGGGAEYGSYSSVGESLSASLPATTTTTPGHKRRSSPPETRTGRTTSVGKAPTSSTRSRSARRSASAHPPSGGGTNSAHPIAVSMPSFGGGAAVSGQWFASSQALAYAPTPEADEDKTGWRPSEGRGVPSSAPTLGSKGRSKAGLDDVEEEGLGSKQAALLTEKRRKRRESHNAVERRRRDNINDRITDLAALLPECLLDQVTASDEGDEGAVGGGLVPSLDGLLAGVSSMTVPASKERQAQGMGKPNKGVVLAKSVEYIRYLQQLVELHQQRTSELEAVIATLRGSHPSQSYPSSFPNPTSNSQANESMNSPGNNGMFSSPSDGEMASPPGGGMDDAFIGWGNMRLKSEDDDDEMLD